MASPPSRRSLPISIGLVFLSLFAYSCGSSTETATAPTPVRCGVQTQSDNVAFPPAGGAATLRITTNRECAWTAASDAEWLALGTPVSGQGDGTLHFTVGDNSAPSTRAGAITVNDQRLQISQDGRPCEFRLSTRRESVDTSGGERRVDVTATSAQCSWRAATDTPWINITAGRDGSGNGAVTFQVGAAAGVPRPGALTIAGQEVVVEQGGACSYVLGATAFSLGAAGGAIDVPITAPPGCAWTIASQAPWITAADTSSGSGSAVVRLRVDATEIPSRTGSVIVAGQAIVVEQTGVCRYGVEPQAYAAPVAGGAATIAVHTAPGCAWAAASTAGWVGITAGAAGNGPGDVRLAVAASGGPARSATVRIADQTVAISQGSGCTIAVTPGSVSVSAQAGTAAVSVDTAPGCEWTSGASAAWITIGAGARGNGAGRVEFSVAANAGPQRNGSVTIGGRTVTVTQANGCTYSIAPAGQDVPGSGGSGVVTVSTAAGCPWTAASQAEWMTMTPPSSSGPGQVQFTAIANASPARAGTLTIAGRTFTVTQASLCTYTFSPPSHEFGADGGNGNVLVIVSGACSWSAVSAAPWITMTAGTSGVGNGLVQFVAAPNPGAARSGIVTIAGTSYTVTEAAR